MRRIIERVVTVVTTTTWTISWQADPVAESDLSDETAKHIQEFSSVITTKEADPVETKTETDSTADEPPLDPNSNQSKIERKSKS
jgi:hypothetical protein